MWCWRKMLNISWQEHRTNGSILTELGLERELMGRVAKLKLQYFGHITRESAVQLALTVLEGIMEGLRHQGRPRRQWIHDIEEWTGCEYIQLKEMSQDRAQWRRKISEWSSAVANRHRGKSTSEWVSEMRCMEVKQGLYKKKIFDDFRNSKFGFGGIWWKYHGPSIRLRWSQWRWKPAIWQNTAEWPDKYVTEKTNQKHVLDQLRRKCIWHEHTYW